MRRQAARHSPVLDLCDLHPLMAPNFKKSLLTWYQYCYVWGVEGWKGIVAPMDSCYGGGLSHYFKYELCSLPREVVHS
jgi:hypothetical protein